jgi:hypothetical protein
VQAIVTFVIYGRQDWWCPYGRAVFRRHRHLVRLQIAAAAANVGRWDGV